MSTLACERVVCACVSVCEGGWGLGVVYLCSTSAYFSVLCVHVYMCVRVCVYVYMCVHTRM